ncbi:MAG: lipoprotein insertase outer membrane protein LolB [Pseudomonadota bacterium]
MRSAVIWVCLLLVGCAAMQERQAPEAPIGEAFYVSARMSVKYGADSASGKITWQHDAVSDELLLMNPLGQGVARIARSDALVTLTTSEQKVYRAKDVETLTEQVLGWRLPFAGLPDWVRGRAVADVPSQSRLDGLQRLSELRQSGWLIEYLEYKGESGRPARLRLSRENVEIRLVVDEWGAAR